MTTGEILDRRQRLIESDVRRHGQGRLGCSHEELTRLANELSGFAWRECLTGLGITPKHTRPYRPQTNGKIERFHRILLEEWAYIRDWTNDHERSIEYDHFIHF